MSCEPAVPPMALVIAVIAYDVLLALAALFVLALWRGRPWLIELNGRPYP